MGSERKVQLYDAGTKELIQEFATVKECAAYLGIDSSQVSNNINGRYKTICKGKYCCKPVDSIYYKPIEGSKIGRIGKAVDVFYYGKLYGTFDSVKEAANETGIAPTRIYNRCRDYKIKDIKGYNFKYNRGRSKAKKLVPVDLYDADTNELFMSFKDISECANFLGLTVQTIRQNLRGDLKTVKVRSFYCKSSKYE